MLGSIEAGTPIAWSIGSLHCSVSRSISMVRLAFVTSVTCSPVSFQMTHESIVPNRAVPAAAAAATAGTLSISQRIFGPEKYVASGNPVMSR